MESMVIEGASGQASPAVLACARAIEDYFTTVVAELDVLRDGLAQVLTRDRLLASDLIEAAHPLTAAMLERLPLFGGGFVAAPGLLHDHHLYLAWWQGVEQQLLAQSTMVDSGDPLDYSRFEWFRWPIESGHAHVTGPFVDYVCSDEYMLTTSAPVIVGDRAVGVVGADTLLDTFESMMLGLVREAEATVVNETFRVVLAADPRVPPGQLVSSGDHPTRVRCRDLPFTVMA